MLVLQTLLFSQTVLARFFEFCRFFAEGAPRAEYGQKRTRLIFLLVRIDCRCDLRVAVPARFVLFLQTLDLGLRVRARLVEVFGGVVEFILIKFHLRPGNVNLVLEIFFLRFGSRGQFASKLCNVLLVVFDCLFGVGLSF